ncbi:MAG: recombinase family protein, partial [Phycisphaerae bacterium]|nr:recombinase family protein [Phycisphaerae bacterium]
MLTTREPASRRKRAAATASTLATVRCAIYTRKSSDEGLQQEFNSLDAQREAAEAYIASQKAEGWVCPPDRYDDGGFTGGNMDRPALKRLLADIEAGKIDCVVVYKVDRLSRSLMDFARIVEVFERHNVSFVSVTQHFNTTNSMGRLTLNVLLSFAQFEREIIGERIRDKIAASRQKGKWTGGTPILGYDVDRSNGSPRLVVNAAEASRVRQIFDLYLELGTLLPVVSELERRGWCNKAWTTQDGRRRGRLRFDKCRVHMLLTNVLYAGKVAHKGELYAGEHEAIVPEDVFDRVQQQLRRHSRSGVAEARNRHGALLRGLLFCRSCRRAMSHTFTTKASRRYRYYTCTNAVKRGRAACPSRSLPAAEVEKAVVDQIRCIGQDPEVLRETLAQARDRAESAIERLAGERREIERALARLHADIRRTVSGDDQAATAPRIAEL